MCDLHSVTLSEVSPLSLSNYLWQLAEKNDIRKYISKVSTQHTGKVSTQHTGKVSTQHTSKVSSTTYWQSINTTYRQRILECQLLR
jgi:hypothetical protein